MNPARSLGPALVSFTWTAQWVYVSAPFLGAIAGALLYRWIREAGQLPPSAPSRGVSSRMSRLLFFVAQGNVALDNDRKGSYTDTNSVATRNSTDREGGDRWNNS